MLDNPLVSIVVPVYNTAKYLPQCLNSIFRQNYRNIEIICINDCSTDNSKSVLYKYEPNHSNLKIINKTNNEGVDRARFDGIKIANGDYITFIDSDDWFYDESVISHMISKMKEFNVDYVEVGITRCLDRHGWIKKRGFQSKTGYFKEPDLFNQLYITFFGLNLISINMCGKLYKTEVIKSANMKPSGFKMGEDLVFNLMLFPSLKSIYISNVIGYCYRFGGMTSKYNPSLLANLKQQFILKEQLINVHNYEKATPYLRNEMKNILISDIVQRIRFLKQEKESIISSIKKELEDPIWNRVPDVSAFKAYTNNTFVQGIKEKNAEVLYNYCYELVKRNRSKTLFKKIISKIAQNI